MQITFQEEIGAFDEGGVSSFVSRAHAIEYINMGFPELETLYQIILDRTERPSIFTMKVELAEQTLQSFKKRRGESNKLIRRIREKVHNVPDLSSIIEK